MYLQNMLCCDVDCEERLKEKRADLTCVLLRGVNIVLIFVRDSLIGVAVTVMAENPVAPGVDSGFTRITLLLGGVVLKNKTTRALLLQIPERSARRPCRHCFPPTIGRRGFDCSKPYVCSFLRLIIVFFSGPASGSTGRWFCISDCRYRGWNSATARRSFYNRRSCR